MTRLIAVIFVALGVTLSASANRLSAQEETPTTITPRQAMDYFTGDWSGVGVQGNYRYKGRDKTEWDLHHNVTSHRIEFFGPNFAQTLAMVRWINPQSKKIAEHQFASWGIYRKGEYEVVPYGEWFQLVGPCEQTGENGTRTSINIVTVHDQDHYTWGMVPQLGSPGTPATEEYARAGMAHREDTSNRTDEYLQDAIQFLEKKTDTDVTGVMDLKKALARFLLSQNRHAEAIAVLGGILPEQKERLPADHPDVATTVNAVVQACRNGAFSACMDEEASPDRLATALQMARQAAGYAPDDRRIWLQAFAHYRLGDIEAARKAMRDSLATDNVFPNVLLLAALIEHKAGDADVAHACYAMGVELAGKSSSGGPAAFLEMAGEAIGPSPEVDKMDKAARLSLYETALKAFPQLAMAYRLRGRFYGGLAEWDKALADYHQAAELLPSVLRHREGEAAIVLCRGTPEEKDAICRKFFEEWEGSDLQTQRMDMVLMCSLSPTAKVDRQRLVQIAEEVFASMEPRAFLYVAKGMALYRLQQYQKAAATISVEGSVNPKDMILGQAFLAMAHKKLGHDAQARQFLNLAQGAAREQLAEPGGKPLPYQDRPVLWCMVQVALQEAEQVVNGP